MSSCRSPSASPIRTSPSCSTANKNRPDLGEAVAPRHLTDEHVANAARAFDRSPFTIRRWLRKATAQGGDTRGRSRFVLTPQMRDAVARWRGNATAAYREPTEEQALGLPSRATFHRAVYREISPGHRAGLRQGE